MLRHVEELLQAAPIDSGALVLRVAPCDVAALAREAAAGFSGLLEDRDARLVLRCALSVGDGACASSLPTRGPACPPAGAGRSSTCSRATGSPARRRWRPDAHRAPARGRRRPCASDARGGVGDPRGGGAAAARHPGRGGGRAAAGEEGERLRALAGVARTVRRRLRRSDVLVRDGDRFAALMVNAGEEDARAVGAAVQEALGGGRPWR